MPNAAWPNIGLLLQAQEQLLASQEAARRGCRQSLEQAQRSELQATAALEIRRRLEQVSLRRERLVRERASLTPNLQAAELALLAEHADVQAADQAVMQAQQLLQQANTLARGGARRN